MKTGEDMEAPENSSRKGRETMKKTSKLACLVLIAGMLASGCGDKGPSKTEYRIEGIEKLESGDYAGAIDSFELAIEKSGGAVGKFQIDVLKYRGEAEYRLNDYEAAAHTYDVLLQLDDKNPEYRYLRCMSYAMAGNLDKALEDYTGQAGDGKERSPLADTALLVLGAALEEQGDTGKAMTLYQEAAALGVINSELYNRMGLCKLKEKSYEEALAYFNQGIQAGDETILPSLKFNQAVTYEYQGEFSKALEAFEAYVSAYGSNEEADREIAFLKTR